MRSALKLPSFALLLLLFHPAPSLADFGQIRDLIRRGEFAAAIKVCDRDLKLRPRDFQTWTLRAIALQGMGRNEESLDSFRQSLKIRPDFLPALQAAAQLEYEMRDPECRRTLAAILSLDPGAAAAYAMLGVLAFEQKDCPAATEHFERAGEAANDPAITLRLGVCYYQLERWSLAEAQFSKLLSLREDDRTRYNLGLTQLNAKQASEAVATLQPLARRELPDSDSMSLLAAAYEANKQTPEALQVLRRAIDLYPREERFYVDLASLCLEHKAIPLGVQVLEAGAQNIPQSARIRMMLGIMHSSAEFFDKAEESFKKAEQLAPDAAYGQVGLAITLMRTGGADQMIRLLREQDKRTPGIPLVSLSLADALLQKNASPAELQEAESLMRSLIERQPSQAKAHALLAKVHSRMGRTDDAVRSLERAVGLDASDLSATYQLMLLYRRIGRAREAAALKEKVQQLQVAEKTGAAEARRYQLIGVPENRTAQ